jgi:hypothetical protein
VQDKLPILHSVVNHRISRTAVISHALLWPADNHSIMISNKLDVSTRSFGTMALRQIGLFACGTSVNSTAPLAEAALNWLLWYSLISHPDPYDQHLNEFAVRSTIWHFR